MKHTATVVIVFAACAACGSSSDTDGGTATRGASDGPIAASGCDQAAALCDKLSQCAPFLLAAGYGDVTQCSARLTNVCTEQASSDGSGMTRASIQACKAALATATCDDVFGNRLAECAFRGSFADGTACGDNSQCASGFCNRSGNLCGACSAKQPVGAACPSGSNDECQTGLVCSTGKVCASPATVGGPCDDKTQPCLYGSFCTTAKTCARTVAVGESCPGAYINIADGTFCTGRDAVAKSFGTAASGQECGLAPGAGKPATLCAPGGVPACTPLSDSIPVLGMPTHGMCAAGISDGFTCTAASVCMAGAQCIAGTCQIPSGKLCSESN